MYVTLIICHAKCVYCTILPSVACLLCHIFPHYLVNVSFIKKKLLNIWFSLHLSETFLVLRIIQWNTVINVHGSLVLSDFNETWIFSTHFRKTLGYQSVWKSIEWEHSCTLQMDGWTGRHTEMTKLRVAFHNSMNTPKNEYLCSAVDVQN